MNKKKKILIADSDPKIAKAIKSHKGSSHYLFETASNGFECLAKIETFHPDLIFMELLLPHIHGIEILRKVKSDPRTNHIGMILTGANTMIQDYRSAVNARCDDFLQKPLELSSAFSAFKRFFLGHLHPSEFTSKEHKTEGKHCYFPKLHSPNSYIKFWGTRGSNPVSGSEYVRFGGNTCCLEIRHGHDLIIVDAGTGIRPLGTILSKPKNIHLLISHTHWDHLAGFPFFAPVYDPHCHLTVYAPHGFEKTTREVFTEMLAYAYFPVRLDDIKSQITFKDIHEREPFQIGSIKVDTHYAYHPGATICFKFCIDKTTFGYVTDNEFLMGYHGNPSLLAKNSAHLAPYQSMIKFFKGTDFLVHEAQYTPIEYQTKVGWGHSSIANAATLLKHADIPEWIITHHDPKHTDMDLLKKSQMHLDVLDDLKMSCRPRMAFDGMTIPL